MQEGYWVIRTIKAGQVGEKTKFWVPGKRPEKSGRRTRSEIKKQEQNDYACVKTLARLINANFHPGDLLMGLDYNADGYRKVLERAEKMDADGGFSPSIRLSPRSTSGISPAEKRSVCR